MSCGRFRTVFWWIARVDRIEDKFVTVPICSSRFLAPCDFARCEIHARSFDNQSLYLWDCIRDLHTGRFHDVGLPVGFSRLARCALSDSGAGVVSFGGCSCHFAILMSGNISFGFV